MADKNSKKLAVHRLRQNAISLQCTIDAAIYRVSQKKRGAFVGLWRRIESFDHHELNFSKQLTV